MSLLSSKFAALLPSGSVRRRLVVGGFWSLSGNVALRGLQMLAMVFCARMLGKSLFGELGMIQSTVITFGVFAGLGLGLTTTVHMAAFHKNDPLRAGRVLTLMSSLAGGMGLLVVGLLVGFAPLIAARTMGAAHLALPLAIASGILAFSVVDGVQKGCLVGFEAFAATARINMITGAASLILVVAGAYWFKVSGALAGLVGVTVLQAVLNNLEIRRVCRAHAIHYSLRDCWREWPLLWSFSFPAFLSGALVAPAMWLSNLIMVRQGGGFTDLGVISASTQVRQMAQFIPTTAFAALLPILISDMGRRAGQVSNRMRVLNSYATWYLATVISVLLLLGVRSLVRLFGADFADDYRAMALVLCCIPIVTYTDGFGRLIQASGLMGYSVLSNALWGVILIAATYQLAPRGAAGVSIAYLLAYGLSVLIMVPIFMRRLKMTRTLALDALLAVFLAGAVVLAFLAGAGDSIVQVRSMFAVGSVVLLLLVGLRIRFELTRTDDPGQPAGDAESAAPPAED